MNKTNGSIKDKKTGLTITQCKSGRYLAYFDNPTNIVSNGDTREEALSNLNLMLAAIVNDSYNFFMIFTCDLGSAKWAVIQTMNENR